MANRERERKRESRFLVEHQQRRHTEKMRKIERKFTADIDK